MRFACLIPFCLAASFSMAFAQGSGSKGSGSNASLSLLQLEDPLEACLLAGAQLYHRKEKKKGEEPAFVIEKDTQSLIWSITFDQSIVEVNHQDDYLFASTEQIEFGECK